MKMISLTGNKPSVSRRNPRGYTFLELMVTVAILSIGIVAIYKGLITSLDYQTQLSCRLCAMNLMDHEIARIEKEFEPQGEFPSSENGKIVQAVLDYREVPFEVSAQVNYFPNLEGLAQAEVTLTWPDRGRDMRIKRTIYLLSLKLKIPPE